LPGDVDGEPQAPQISVVAVSPPSPSRPALTPLIVSPLVNDVWHIAVELQSPSSAR
jgi:hypothetical protein